MSHTSSKPFVRLDTMCHDASSEPYSAIEHRWAAYTLIAFVDLWDVLHSTDDEFVAQRESWPEAQKKAFEALHDAMWAVLKGIGFSKWDMRTHSWVAHSLFYADELEGDASNNHIYADKMMWEMLARYRSSNHDSELGQRQFDFSRQGIENQLSDAEMLTVAEWYQRWLAKEEEKRNEPVIALADKVSAMSDAEREAWIDRMFGDGPPPVSKQ